MKKHLATLIAGVLIIGTLFGLMLYFVEKKMLLKDIIMLSILFGISMALGEIFIFEKIRNRKKEK
ncbi:MAG TPA: hypothetical protein PLL09_06195 [Flavobacterium sp.]|uniref:hypothetical protein n=1 Tax=unclassified Flavobacterium TaxID=196869 RepID=UPI000E96A8AC|nr:MULTISPECIES: hypothetical protein [unclassified Flavobacterium]HBI00691.1 hypothetical protein [Flavobacterium sp.]HRE77397.1 hypothetical protein [Flavobacterium sp.]